ncbi:MAG: Uma2 family endonuclease [Campylobacterales bacterium]|nr:Uma2 family endonuclease [Campylobacterales bacterium]
MALVLVDLPHYTYDDYVEWEGKWELIDGIAYAMAPSPGFEHQSISQCLAAELHNALKACRHCKALLPIDWQISDDTIVQPDNMVFCGEIRGNKKLLTTPSIIFEILSPSTSHKDRSVKYRLYEAAGVEYYVIISPSTKVSEIYKLHEGHYLLEMENEKERFGFELPECHFELDFATLF